MSTNLAYIYDLEDDLQADLGTVLLEPDQSPLQPMPLSANVSHYDMLDDDECCNLYMVPA